MTTTEIPLSESYGYYILDTPEKKAKFAPQQPADEYRTLFGEWQQIAYADRFCAENIYRRRIPVGEGFELVGLDDVICAGDECATDDWWVGANTTVGKTVRSVYSEFHKPVTFRRRKSAPSAVEPSDAWTPIEKAVPTDTTREVIFLRSKEPPVRYFANWKPLNDYKPFGYTHWSYGPAPTPPPIDPAEAAFEKAQKECNEDCRRENEESGWTLRITDRTKKRQRLMFNAGRAYESSLKGAANQPEFPKWVSSEIGKGYRIDSETTGVYYDDKGRPSEAMGVQQALRELRSGKRRLLTPQEIAEIQTGGSK